MLFLVNKFSDGVNAPNFSVKTIHCFSDGVNTPKGYKIELSGETESINLVLRDVGLMMLLIVPNSLCRFSTIYLTGKERKSIKAGKEKFAMDFKALKKERKKLKRYKKPWFFA